MYCFAGFYLRILFSYGIIKLGGCVVQTPTLLGLKSLPLRRFSNDDATMHAYVQVTWVIFAFASIVTATVAARYSADPLEGVRASDCLLFGVATNMGLLGSEKITMVGTVLATLTRSRYARTFLAITTGQEVGGTT